MPSGISPPTETTSSSRASRASASSVGRAHDDDPRLGKLAAQLERLGDRDDAERRRAGLERRPRDVDARRGRSRSP